MTKDEKLDEFMKRIGIELSPFQKEIIKKIADENKIYSNRSIISRLPESREM